MTRSQRRAFLFLLIMTLGWLLSRGHVYAAETSHYQRPEDLLDLIPVLKSIPRTFMLGEGYSMKLAGQELQIDHQNPLAHHPTGQPDWMIGVSYVRPVAGFFTSRLDMPLFYAPAQQWSAWAMNDFSNYAAYFSRGADQAPTIRLAFNAKF